ncbi:hypothetical protein BZG35_05885 [Brevundimonas sp. LM2]|nr:hypothetical protein BZG35_05885 [Brevundimonas sp. LM2]
MAEGWRLTGTAPDLTILTRADQPVVPAGTAALVIAVKPSTWRQALAPLLSTLPPATVVVSVMAGIRGEDIAAAVPGRPVVRVMPTTAVAQAQGVAAIWSADPAARALAHALFDPVADAVDLEGEALIDAATAVSGCAPAFFYALAQALAVAGADAGLPLDTAIRLTRGALRSAGAGAVTETALDALIDRIASPGGVTRAGLEALDPDLNTAARAAVAAAVARSKGLAGHQPA